MGPRSLRDGIDLYDLDELQFVTRRAYRRGYEGQFHGRPMRLCYGKIMDINGAVLVHRPAIGEERPKRMPRVTSHDLLLLAVCAWPMTLVVLLLVIAGINIGMRALLHT